MKRSLDRPRTWQAMVNRAQNEAELNAIHFRTFVAPGVKLHTFW